MEKWRDLILARVSALAVGVMALVAFCAPAPSWADGELGLDTGHGSGRRVGDPLDTNDAGGDDDDGSDVHDTTGTKGTGPSILDRISASSRVLLVPQYDGTTLTFRLIFLSGPVDVVEEQYAK